jgi:hypothetical protein
MGKSGVSYHIEWRAHVIVHASRTRDESEGRSWNRLRQTIHLDFIPAGAIWSLAVSCVDRRSNHYRWYGCNVAHIADRKACHAIAIEALSGSYANGPAV